MSILEFGDRLNWNLVTRLDLTAVQVTDHYFSPIASRAVNVDKRIVMVGCKSQAKKATWWLGCRASKRLLATPSSTSEFRPIVFTEQFVCPLDTLTLLKFQSDGPFPYLLVLDIPRWMPQIYIEVWAYDGPDEA